jgi:hypothetical protein
MPKQFHYTIVAYACHLGHLRAGDLPRAGAAMQEYNGWLKRIQDSRKDSSATIRIRTRPGRDI